MKTTRITDPAKCPIKISHVKLVGIWDSVWQHSETEASAYWLIKLAKERGGWFPFTMKELNKLYHAKYPNHDFKFNRLTGNRDSGSDYIQTDADGIMYFTTQFVAEVYRVSPSGEVTND